VGYYVASNKCKLAKRVKTTSDQAMEEVTNKIRETEEAQGMETHNKSEKRSDKLGVRRSG